MSDMIEFIYLNKARSCNIYIDMSADPCFVFVIMLDKELIDLFGTELTIKTDFEKILPHDEGSGRQTALKQHIFDAIRQLPQFIVAQRRLHAFRKKA